MPRTMRKGTAQFYLVPTIASATLAPTTAEVIAGTRLDTQLAEVSGFSFQNNPIATPDMADDFVSMIPGEETTEDSSMDFYELRTANPIKTALAKGTDGYVVIFYDGIAGTAPAAGDKVDVWPIIVNKNTRLYTAANEAAKYQVGFSVTSAPGEELSVLA